MSRNMIIIAGVGAGFFYLITNFVGTVQQDDVRYQNEAYKVDHQFDQYQSTDSIGRKILYFTGDHPDQEMAAWNRSSLKQEFLEIFPDFKYLKLFVKERTRGEHFQQRHLRNIEEVEGEFLSGEITAEQAKRKIDLLK